MKIKEAVEIYNKHSAMKLFKDFIEEVKESAGDTFDAMSCFQIKLRFENILNDLKDLADIAIKGYEEVLNGEYKKD